MSVIAVQKTDTKIIFVSDSQMTYANQAYLKTQKIVKVSNIMVGVTGKAKVMPFIKGYLLKIGGELELNSECDVIQLIQSVEKDAGLSTALFTDDVEMLISDGINVWLAHPESLTVFTVESFEAIGSGANYVIGAYKACEDIEKAIEIACEHDLYSSLPLNYEEVERAEQNRVKKQRGKFFVVPA